MIISAKKRGQDLFKLLNGIEEQLLDSFTSDEILKRAIANLILLQSGFINSYIKLMSEESTGNIIGRSVILRSIIETQATMEHIFDNERRASAYLDHTENIRQSVKDAFNKTVTQVSDRRWTTSTVEQRIKNMTKDGHHLPIYALLSNFVHGNNILDIMVNGSSNVKSLESYNEIINFYFLDLGVRSVIVAANGIELPEESSKTLNELANIAWSELSQELDVLLSGDVPKED